MQNYPAAPERRRATAPLYIQIADSLLDQMTAGQLSPNDRLPSERELSAQLKVSRMTVRAALHLLDEMGLLKRRPGDGTYVAQPRIERQAAHLVPFTRSMQAKGYQTSASLIKFEQRPAEVTIARLLDLSLSTPVYYIERLRTVDREPVLLEKFYMPVQRFPDLQAFDLENRSIYEITETEYGTIPQQARQSLEAVGATAYEADLLGLPPGTPLMLERRLAFDQENRPMEYGHDLYKGDRFRFITEIAPLVPWG